MANIMTTILKAKQNAIKNNPEYKTLINAVVSRIGLDSVLDVANYGINGGYGGFIYYSDTVAFWKKYRSQITSHMEMFSAELGENIGEFLTNFNCFEDYEASELLKALYGSYNSDFDIIYNGFAWYAGEEVCRMIELEFNN